MNSFIIRLLPVKVWITAMATAKGVSLAFMAALYISVIQGAGAGAAGATFEIQNGCLFTVWAAGSPGGGKRLERGQSWTLEISNTSTGGRFWGRTGCSFNGSGSGRCNTGDCGGLLNCQGNGSPPMTMFEYTLNEDTALDFYDISLVDGFNLPMSIIPSKSSCVAIACSSNITAICPTELRVSEGCQSACTTLKECGSTNYSKIFKGQCPQAYSYSNDITNTTYTCSGSTDYKVVFCGGNASSLQAPVDNLPIPPTSTYLTASPDILPIPATSTNLTAPATSTILTVLPVNLSAPPDNSPNPRTATYLTATPDNSRNLRAVPYLTATPDNSPPNPSTVPVVTDNSPPNPSTVPVLTDNSPPNPSTVPAPPDNSPNPRTATYLTATPNNSRNLRAVPYLTATPDSSPPNPSTVPVVISAPGNSPPSTVPVVVVILSTAPVVYPAPRNSPPSTVPVVIPAPGNSPPSKAPVVISAPSNSPPSTVPVVISAPNPSTVVTSPPDNSPNPSTMTAPAGTSSITPTSTNLTAPAGNSTQPSAKTSSKRVPILVGSGVVGTALIVMLCLVFGRRIRHWKSSVKKDKILAARENFGQVFFDYKVLRDSTGNFHRNNMLGKGGFGEVYKGRLPDGMDVAVKKLSGKQTNQAVEEFLTEVKLISSVRHRNLVRLLGCCKRRRKLLLVYEFMSNNSLDKHLFGEIRNALSWEKRLNIIVGTAQGLAYLHGESNVRIIHRDIKCANILLDDRFHPKIADFGLARFFPESQTHVSTRIGGTIGYTAPEYAVHGQLTEKADVYSYGIVVLEIVSGRKCVDARLPTPLQLLIEWAWNQFEQNQVLDIVDSSLDGQYPREQALRVIKVALLCTQGSWALRPAMSTVVSMLTNNSESIPQPTRPAFIESAADTSANFIHIPESAAPPQGSHGSISVSLFPR